MSSSKTVSGYLSSFFQGSTTPKTSTVMSNNPQEYEDINIVKLLSKAKFPVYLAFSPTKNENFALKVFGFEDHRPHPYYKNEARFATLNHPNIIKLAYAEDETTVCSRGRDKPVSCILMEYAPHGDFFDFVKKNKQELSEKLIRTYFKQLIEGLEYLHNNGACHLDLKLENLLVGKDFSLKIADFDLSYMVGDSKILTRGTKFYRAPELRASKCKNGASADIYAAGIILFVLKSGGVIPHAEDNLYQGINLQELLNNNPQEFFDKHCSIQGREATYFDADFKSLFLSMVNAKADKRATMNDIKNSRWFKGPVYTQKELSEKVRRMFNH